MQKRKKKEEKWVYLEDSIDNVQIINFDHVL